MPIRRGGLGSLIGIDTKRIMFNFLRNKKIMIGGAVALILAGLVYYMYFSGGTDVVTDDTLLTQSPVSDSDALLGRELLNALSRMRSMKLDATFFADPSFTSLKDWSVELVPELPIGRKNPFAPLASSTAPAIVR
ncbi:MAG: hypothetical protein WCT19_01820 [Candidatus Paceibacterota bacterium]